MSITWSNEESNATTWMTDEMCLPCTIKVDEPVLDGFDYCSYLAAITLAVAASTSLRQSQKCCSNCGGGYMYVFTWMDAAKKVDSGRATEDCAGVCAITPAPVPAT